MFCYRGEGLGKKRQGISEHIAVKKKDDLSGIGMKKQENHLAGEWWKDAFADAANHLRKWKQPRNKRKRKRPASEPSETSSVDKNATSGNVLNICTSDESETDDEAHVSRDLHHEAELLSCSKEDRELFLACKGRRPGRRANILQIGKLKREQRAHGSLKNSLHSSQETTGIVKKSKKSKKKKKKCKKSSGK